MLITKKKGSAKLTIVLDVVLLNNGLTFLNVEIIRPLNSDFDIRFLFLQIIEVKGRHEIVSLVGTLANEGHLHASLSDKDGNVIGGHVMGNMKVFTTAEVVIGNCDTLSFTREIDDETGFDELVVREK